MGLKNKYEAIICLLLISLSLIAYLPKNAVKAEESPEEPSNSREIYLSINESTIVNRRIEFLSKGYVMINDTFTLSWSTLGNMSDLIFLIARSRINYTVGIPKNYSSNLIYYSAYDVNGSLIISLAESDDVFQWFKISFPKPVTVFGNGTYSFTVTYIFTELIKVAGKNRFFAVFPLYPILEEDAQYCNITVVFPSTATVARDDYPQEVFLNKSSDFRELYNLTSPLKAYTNLSSWVRFSSSTFNLLKFLCMKREITIDGWGKIAVTDFYETKMVNVNEVTINLPADATDITVYDAYDVYPKSQVWITKKNSSVIVQITISDKLKNSDKARIAVSYGLPFWKYISKNGWLNYALNINLTKPDEWIIYRVVTKVILPEGASFVQENLDIKVKLEKIGFFQEQAVMERYNITKFESLSVLNIKYQYMVFWIAFRPTLLAVILIGLTGLALMFIRSTSETETIRAAQLPVSLETLKNFIEVYEKKERIMSEMESLEQQSRKGKISRRQYKLRMKILDEQLSSLQRRFNELKDEIESAGGHYADMMRRFDAANAEIEAMKRSISDVELKYRRGDLSAEVRRKLVEEYESRRNAAEGVVEEILLRLREEIL
ncbi:MAG: hypothetical protein QXK89_01805 [Candidatus Bathyarchaeia archaeon]